jgi:hypothetical protein
MLELVDMPTTKTCIKLAGELWSLFPPLPTRFCFSFFCYFLRWTLVKFGDFLIKLTRGARCIIKKPHAGPGHRVIMPSPGVFVVPYYKTL